MYQSLGDVWAELTGINGHKHLWVSHRAWPPNYQNNSRALGYEGQPIILTGPGLVIAEWLPKYKRWSIVDLHLIGRTACHEQSDEIYLSPPDGFYLDQDAIDGQLKFSFC